MVFNINKVENVCGLEINILKMTISVLKLRQILAKCSAINSNQILK